MRVSHASVAASPPPPADTETPEAASHARAPGQRLEFRTFDALRYRDYRLLWLGQACTSMATWMDQVARGWLLYQLTGSVFELGLIRGIQAIPLMLLSPIAGTLADRYNRKAQIVAAQVIDGLLYGAVAILIFTGHIQSWHVYVTALLGSSVQTFQNPARSAMVADAVPRNHLTNAIALNSVVFNLCRSMGPAVAGVSIASMGTGGSYALQAGFYFLATVWTVILPSSLSFPLGTGGRRGDREMSLGRSILEGWRFSWTNEGVRAGLVVTGIASFFIIPFTTMLPVMAKDILAVGASGQGFLLTAMGVGAFVSALLVASLGDQLPRGILMLGGVILYGLSVVAFSASAWFPLSVALMMLVGMFHVSSHALVQTVVQTYSPPEFRGRTMGVFQQSHVVMLCGAMILGGLGSIWGVPAAMGVMAAAGSFTVVVLTVRARGIRSIR